MNIYDDILNIVKTENDIEDFLTEHNEWEYIYNLSNIRKNLLDWYEFNKESSLLEIGAECGALTGLFVERVKKVVAYEADEKKTEIIKARFEKKKNLKVVTGDWDNLVSTIEKKAGRPSKDNTVDKTKFDYVTIIGSPNYELIKKAVAFLRPGGTLIVACDNKYGTSRWSQDVDLEKYSRSNLVSAIKYAGADQNFRVYYPVPNFVLPTDIFSGERLPKAGDIRDVYPNYIDGKYVVFNENKTIDSLINDGMYEQFANSFLMIGSKSK